MLLLHLPNQTQDTERVANRRTFVVPAVVAAYNSMMNAVDRVANSAEQTQYGERKAALRRGC